MLTHLENGTPYRVEVRARNHESDGPWSGEWSGRPKAVPDKVVGLMLAAGDGSITATWVEPHDNDSPITGYDVEYRESPSGSWNLHNYSDVDNCGKEDNRPCRTYNVDGLTNGDSYDFRVRANNNNGAGPWSDIATKSGPTNLKLSATWVSVKENEGRARYGVSLASAPSSAVTLKLSVSGDADAVEIEPKSLSFHSTNWNAVQVVTIAGVDDATHQPDHRDAEILHTATSTNADFNNRTALVDVTIHDDDPDPNDPTPDTPGIVRISQVDHDQLNKDGTKTTIKAIKLDWDQVHPAAGLTNENDGYYRYVIWRCKGEGCKTASSYYRHVGGWKDGTYSESWQNSFLDTGAKYGWPLKEGKVYRYSVTAEVGKGTVYSSGHSRRAQTTYKQPNTDKIDLDAVSGNGFVGLDWQPPEKDTGGNGGSNGQSVSSLRSIGSLIERGLRMVRGLSGGSEEPAAPEYDVSYTEAGKDWSEGYTETVTDTSTVIEALENGVSYAFRVRSVTNGEAGPWSDTATATPKAPDNAPVEGPSYEGVESPALSFVAGEAVAPVTLPAASGGSGALTYSVAPALANGLAFPDLRHANRGRRSGKPHADRRR